MSVTIRPIEEADIAAADAVIRAAFERPVDFQPMLRLHRLIEPEGFWVAVDDSQVVGTVGAVDYGRVAYIALMTVDPARQSCGLGRRLMEHALAWLEQRGCRVVLLDATEKGARLYETMDFVDDAWAYDFVRSESLPWTPPGDFRVVKARPADVQELVAFDAPLFGADRGKLFVALWQQFGERALIAHDRDGALAGYLFALDPVLGPWAAQTRAAAEDLLSAALALPHQHEPMVMVPRGNEHAVEILLHSGFIERRRLRHMRGGAIAHRVTPRSCTASPASDMADLERRAWQLILPRLDARTSVKKLEESLYFLSHLT